VIESEEQVNVAELEKAELNIQEAQLSEPSDNIEPEDTDLNSASTETTEQNTPVEELAQLESIEALESEVSELESEIQLQMDKLVIKSDHLKANIQSELKRVSADNEQLQQQITTLTQQLSEAEEKIQSLAEVQDRQQVLALLILKSKYSLMKDTNVPLRS
jgi:chromosome segregation ATPase